jgi:DNA-binding CsgD family transcriptional regulator
MPVTPTIASPTQSQASLNGGTRNGHSANSPAVIGDAPKAAAIADALKLLNNPEPKAELIIARQTAGTAKAWDISINQEKFSSLTTEELEAITLYINHGGELEDFIAKHETTAAYMRKLEATRKKLDLIGLPDHSDVQFLIDGLLGGFFNYKLTERNVSFNGPILSEQSAEILLLRAAGYNPEQIECFKKDDENFTVQKTKQHMGKLKVKTAATNTLQTIIHALALGLVDLDLIRAKRAEIEAIEQNNRKDIGKLWGLKSTTPTSPRQTSGTPKERRLALEDVMPSAWLRK